jgi:hypothetical protein
MNQLTNDTSLNQPTKTTFKPNVTRKVYEECNKCKKGDLLVVGSRKICRTCYLMETFKPSGNTIIDNFITSCTQINLVIMEFAPYGQFKNIEFIAEGGFSKIYKATWVDGPITNWSNINNGNIFRKHNRTVVLKKLNNSKNITSKELNEVTYNTH